MFTIKAYFDGGHAVHECASYRFRKPGCNVGDTIADKHLSSLDLMNADGGVARSFMIDDTVYVMNSLGKTVDTFHGPPRGVPQ